MSRSFFVFYKYFSIVLITKVSIGLEVREVFIRFIRFFTWFEEVWFFLVVFFKVLFFSLFNSGNCYFRVSFFSFFWKGFFRVVLVLN